MRHTQQARLAQSVEHETLNLRVVGSSPTLGDQLFLNYEYLNFSGDWAEKSLFLLLHFAAPAQLFCNVADSA